MSVFCIHNSQDHLVSTAQTDGSVFHSMWLIAPFNWLRSKSEQNKGTNENHSTPHVLKSKAWFILLLGIDKEATPLLISMRWLELMSLAPLPIKIDLTCPRSYVLFTLGSKQQWIILIHYEQPIQTVEGKKQPTGELASSGFFPSCALFVNKTTSKVFDAIRSRTKWNVLLLEQNWRFFWVWTLRETSWIV